MPAETFSHWLDGAPVLGARSAFAYWLDGALVVEGADLTATVIFTGEVTKPKVRGKKILATLVPGGVAFDQQVPRFLFGPLCNHLTGANPDGGYLMSYGCGLLKADWKFTASVTTPISSAYPFELNVDGLARVTGAAPAYFADWFANAVLEIGSGANVQRRRILSSTLPVAGAMTVTLNQWFTTSPADNAPVVIYPQCDGRWVTCQAYHAANNPEGRFANADAFGGHPFIPHGNPSAHDATDLSAAGGKK
jgi:hypothetical protein